MLVKVVEKRVRDKRRGKTYTSKMLTLPKSLVKMWGDVDFVMLEIDKRGRLIVTPVPAPLAAEYAEGRKRVEV
jgi:hypothetical protein